MTDLGGAAGRSRLWQSVAVWLVVAVVAVAAADSGLRLRRWAWDATEGVRFKGDVSNGWLWGDLALRDGLFAFYDVLNRGGSTDAPQPSRRNDYTPLRLAAMTAWVRWTHTHYPSATGWQEDYEFTAPLLNANAAATGASAVLVFVLIRMLKRRLWVARAGLPSFGHRRNVTGGSANPPGPPGPSAACGLPSAVLGGLLVWFNPVVIWDGHCWPQWDVWLMPFYVAAVLLACVDGWFFAGVSLVIGAFLKGQMLLVAPVLLVWPLLAGRFGAAYRLTGGLAFATAAIALPWMRLGTIAWVWCGTMAAAFVVLTPAVWRRRLRWRWLAVIPVAAILLAWPWAAAAPFGTKLLAFVPPVVVVLQGGVPRRLRATGYALAAAATILLTMALFDASRTWFTMGFVYGTEKYGDTVAGSTTWNVPSLLIEYLQWDRDPNRPVVVPGLAEPVRLRVLLETAGGVALAACGLAAAVQARRRDTRLLVAVAVPWLWCFLLLPQMRGRYTVWAAGLSGLLAGESIGLALLGVAVSVVGTLGLIANQYKFQPQYDPETLDLLLRLGPHLAWVLLTAAAVQTYVALTPRRAVGPLPSRTDPASAAIGRLEPAAPSRHDRPA